MFYDLFVWVNRKQHKVVKHRCCDRWLTVCESNSCRHSKRRWERWLTDFNWRWEHAKEQLREPSGGCKRGWSSVAHSLCFQMRFKRRGTPLLSTVGQIVWWRGFDKAYPLASVDVHLGPSSWQRQCCSNRENRAFPSGHLASRLVGDQRWHPVHSSFPKRLCILCLTLQPLNGNAWATGHRLLQISSLSF